jgi:hypothetical protein
MLRKKIECPKCKGDVEKISETKSHVGSQIGDGAEYAKFLKCAGCGAIFYANGSIEDAIEIESGPLFGLSLDRLLEAISQINGNYYPEYNDSNLLAFLYPDKFSGVFLVLEDGKIILPKELAGRKVSISVVKSKE